MPAGAVARPGATSGTAEGRLAVSFERADSLERYRRDSLERRMMAKPDTVRSVPVVDVVLGHEPPAKAVPDSAAAVVMSRSSAATTNAVVAPASASSGEFAPWHDSGFYIGLAGGAVAPTGNLRNLGYNSGASIDIPMGWHPRQQLLGVRVDLGYAQFRGRDFSGDLPNGSTLVLNNINPQVLSLTANLTLRVPVAPSQRVIAYALSGAGLYQFRSFGAKTALGGFLGNDVLAETPAGFRSVRNKLGAQFGAGLEVGVGPAALFVESRVVNVFANRPNNVQLSDYLGANRGRNLRWMPIMLGVNFR